MNRPARILIALLAVALFFVGAPSSFAHTTGASWEQTTDGYKIDVGYDPAQFQAGLYTRFDFSIKDPTSLDPKDFAEVWVRILGSEKNTLLATGIRHEPIGPTTLLYNFQQSGDYTLDASFRDKDGNEIVDAQFPISVGVGAGSARFSDYVVPLLALVVGICIGLFVRAFIARRSSSAQSR